MSEPALQLRDHLARLPKEERAELAHFLIDTLKDEFDVDNDPAWEAELQRREAAFRSGAAKAIPAEEVMARLREKYS